MKELELVERDAYASMFTGAPPSVDAAVRVIADASCVRLGAVQTTMLNRACGLGIERTATDSDLDAIDGFFGTTAYAVPVAPQAEALPDLLRRRGFEPSYAWMKFRRDASPPPPVRTELRVEEIDRSRGGDFGHVVAAAFGLPQLRGWWPSYAGCEGWHCFVAYEGREPAAAGALFASGRTGWLGVAGTAPEFRRRGGQGAIMAARIEKARALELELLVTETGERVEGRASNSYRNILRFGFEEAYVRPNYERSMASA